MPIHSQFTGNELHEPYHFVQENDPGAVGAKLYWLKVSTGALKRRNDINSAWVSIGSVGITKFTELLDCPSAYTGQTGKSLRVKSDETALEFYDPAAATLPNWVTNNPDTPPISANAMDDEFTANSLDAKWAWVNQGSATVSFTNSLANFAINTIGSRSIRMITQPVPAGNWEFVTKCTPVWIPDSTTSGTTNGGYAIAYTACGLTLRNSSSSNLTAFYITFDSYLRAYIQRMPNNTGFTSTNYFYNALKPQQWYWLKIKKTSTKYQFSISLDGSIYFQFGEETVGAYITADQIGFCMDALSGTAFNFTVDYFRRIS